MAGGGVAYAPMLAVAGHRADVGPDRAVEFKWDGVRALAEVRGGRLTLRSRRGTDVTATYPELAGLAAALGRDAVLDGEIVALDERSRPSFARLQRRLQVTDPGRAARAAAEAPVTYLAFDLLALDGDALVERPYRERRGRLEELGLGGGRWQVPPARAGVDPDRALAAAAEHGLEGIVAKRLDSPYRPGQRSRDWVKVVLVRRGEFVVGGWLPGEGSRAERVGSLLVGCHEPDGALVFAGAVGTGLGDRELADLGGRLAALATDACPFRDPPPRPAARWVAPELVVEVRFREWTPDGLLRQPSYTGQRPDKTPDEVRCRDDGDGVP